MSRVLSKELQGKADNQLILLGERIKNVFPEENQDEKLIQYLEAISKAFAEEPGSEALILSIFFRKEAQKIRLKEI